MVFIGETAEFNVLHYLLILYFRSTANFQFCCFNFTRNYFIALNDIQSWNSSQPILPSRFPDGSLWHLSWFYRKSGKCICVCVVHVCVMGKTRFWRRFIILLLRQAERMATPLTLNLRERKRGAQVPHS